MEDRLGVLLIEPDPEVSLSVRLIFAEIKESTLHVVSSCTEALNNLPEWYPDLILMAHNPENSSAEYVNFFQQYPSAQIICSVPVQNEEWIDRYVRAGANGIVIKNGRYLPDLTQAVKKALIRIVERKSFLLESLSGTSFFTDDDVPLSQILAGALQPGETILHYKVVEEIGEGGMGEIYRAEDLKLGRQVAIKVLPPKIARNRKMKERLAREARAASALNHPNIVIIHAIEETPDLSFIVMEFVEGKSLYKILEDGPIPLSRVLNFGKQIAEALDAAHQIGVVHRDIKPANIMITGKDHVKLLDFGLAKWVAGPEGHGFPELKRPDLTGVGAVLGTAMYMSPEQSRGETLDGRSDIFSLGCILYEAATGKRPFQGSSILAVMDAIANAEYAPASLINKQLPESFDRLVMKTLAKEKTDRYGSAAELVENLCALLEQMPPSGSKPRHTSAALSGKTDSAMSPVGRFYYARPNIWIPVAIFLLILLGFSFRLATKNAPGAAPGVIPPITSVAVLPLRNISGDPEEEYFADGLTESLIADLAKIRKLKVISRTSVMHYKGSNLPLPKIAKELKVDAIVEGSVLRAGNKVRITAELIHAPNEVHLWADRYERPLGDILTLQDELAQAISKEIQARAAPGTQGPIKHNRPVNAEAYEAYLRGKYQWNKRTKKGLEKAVQYFREAIALEPDYAIAYSALADTWQVMGSMQFIPPGQYLQLSRAAAEKALELDNSLAEAHTSLAADAAHEWRWDEAAAEYQKAIQLNPNYATAHQWYSILLMALNDCDHSIAEIKKALDLDPISFAINLNLGHTFSHCGRYEEALAQYEKTKEIDPNHWALYGAFAETYERMGRYEDAIEAYATSWSSDERSKNEAAAKRAALLKAYRVNGVTGYWEMLLKTEQGNPVATKISEASYYALLGKRDQAFAKLEEAFQEHDPSLFMLQFWPELKNLRSDPRYADLVHRMGLPSSKKLIKP